MSRSSQSIRRFLQTVKRDVTAYELRTLGGFTPAQIARAVSDGTLVANEPENAKAAVTYQLQVEKKVEARQSET